MTRHLSRQPGGEGLPSDTKFLHRSVADALRQRITHGRLSPGFKLPSLRELAGEFGVSMVTVNRALEQLEHEKRIYRVAGVGVFAHPIASGVSAVRRMLTLAVPNLGGQFDTGIARGVEKACQDYGWGTQILNAHLDPVLERRNFGQLFDCGSQGAIILPTGDPANMEGIFRAHSSEYPVVVVDKFLPGLRADFVESDHEGGAYQATRYLLEHGHRHIRLLTTRMLISSVVARMNGYERALVDGGFEPRPDLTMWVANDAETHREAMRGKRWIPGYRAVLPVLADCPKPVAIFAIDCYLAWGVYVACQELGLRIPEDVSVIAFDDAEFADAIQPSMTIMVQRTDEIGRAAVEMFVERAAGERGGTPHASMEFRHRIIGVDLIERDSVADLAGAEDR